MNISLAKLSVSSLSSSPLLTVGCNAVVSVHASSFVRSFSSSVRIQSMTSSLFLTCSNFRHILKSAIVFQGVSFEIFTNHVTYQHGNVTIERSIFQGINGYAARITHSCYNTVLKDCVLYSCQMGFVINSTYSYAARLCVFDSYGDRHNVISAAPMITGTYTNLMAMNSPSKYYPEGDDLLVVRMYTESIKHVNNTGGHSKDSCGMMARLVKTSILIQYVITNRAIGTRIIELNTVDDAPVISHVLVTNCTLGSSVFSNGRSDTSIRNVGVFNTQVTDLVITVIPMIIENVYLDLPQPLEPVHGVVYGATYFNNQPPSDHPSFCSFPWKTLGFTESMQNHLHRAVLLFGLSLLN